MQNMHTNVRIEIVENLKPPEVIYNISLQYPYIIQQTSYENTQTFVYLVEVVIFI